MAAQTRLLAYQAPSRGNKVTLGVKAGFIRGANVIPIHGVLLMVPLRDFGECGRRWGAGEALPA